MEKFLTYEQFGARGDGLFDDFDAIIATHEEANRTGTPVKAKDGAKYYLAKPCTAIIKTCVDFGTAEFIIDDSRLTIEDRGHSIFSVESDFAPFTPDIKTLSAGAKKVDFPHEGNVYVRIFNDKHKIFIRKGLNMNDGTPTQDCFVVDADGNIKTDIDWDYPEITKAYAKCIDDAPLTIKGGKFTTIANQAESFYNYYSRNVSIKRSGVTVEGLTHLVVGELDHGAPYGSFIGIHESVNVTVKDCLLTPHLIYNTPSKVPGKLVPMGSYDINLAASINVRCINITQSVDIHNGKYWGIVCSNFCKDLYFEGCTISRFDAHQGVTNVTLRNCEFGHQKVNLIGHGEALIENCTMTGSTLFGLREDYGSIWDGNITVRDCTLKVSTRLDFAATFGARNLGDHDFGFVCRAPRVYEIDGLTIDDSDCPEKSFYILPDYTSGAECADASYPYVPTERLILKNVKRVSGKPYAVTANAAAYENLITEER